MNDKKEKLPYNRVRTKRKHGQGGFLMSEKMLVTQALDERDLLVKKINSKIAKASFVDTIKPNEEKVFAGNMKKEDYAKEAEAAFQQIMDLIDRYQKIDAAIVASNASTFVTTSYGTYSVAGAIAPRNRLRGKGTYSGEADFEKTLADKMSGEYRARVRFCDDKNSVLQGSAEGILRGGNMAVAYGLRGTPYDIPAAGTVLFIEDVSERPHAIERMMYNLKLGGVLEKLSGLIVGQFTEYEEDRSLGKELYAALADLVKEYDYPVCFNFPVGHVAHNLPLINGARVEFTVGKKNVELKFIC